MSGINTEIGHIPGRYDAARMAVLREEEAKLTTSIEERRDYLLQEHESFHNDAEMGAYAVKCEQYRVLQSDREAVRGEIARMELVKPEVAKAKAQSPLSRFLRSGVNGIARDEAEEHAPVPGFAAGAVGEGFGIHAQTRSDDASGQELVQETVVPDVVERLASFGGLDRAAMAIMTGTGNELRYPQFDEATKKGRILGAQNTAVTADDMADFGVVTFQARTASSDPIVITLEMIQDSVIDIEGYAERVSMRRMGRAWADEFHGRTGDAGGDGTGNRAVSLFTATTKGTDAGTADTIGVDDLVNLVYSVNRAYRDGTEMGEGGFAARTGFTGFLMSDEGEKAVYALKDEDGRPLWVPSFRDGVPDRLLRYPVMVDTSNTDGITVTGHRPIYFGNFGYFAIRTVAGIEFYRFSDSRTMQNHAVECMAFSRRDARPMGAGAAANQTEAIKYLAAQ